MENYNLCSKRSLNVEIIKFRTILIPKIKYFKASYFIFYLLKTTTRAFKISLLHARTNFSLSNDFFKFNYIFKYGSST